MHFLAYVLSITLHIAFLVGAYYLPQGKNTSLLEDAVLISLVDGEISGNELPTPILGAAGLPGETIAPSLETENQLPKAVEEEQEIEQEIPKEEPKEVPKEVPKEEPKEIPKEVPKEEPLPKPEAPKPAPLPVQEVKKPEPKPEVKEKPKPKPEPKPKPKPAPKPNPKPKPKPQNKRPGADQDSVNRALAEARRNSGGFRGGGGGAGRGTGGGGLNAVYMGQVMQAVRPHWDYESATRVNHVAEVRVKLNSRGDVLSAELETSSGNIQFDSSAVNAVIRTGDAQMFPAPPTKQYRELILIFSRDMLQ